MKPALLLCLLSLTTAAWAQTPTITAVENAATNILPGLPNSPIAQGSLFVVKGANLGPASIVIATQFPLALTQAGTSVQITIGGKTVSGIMYYTLATQIAAILPSATPTGTGTLTVTFSGATSASFPITVVPNNIGIFTVATNGIGDAIATLANNSLVTPTNAPSPGDTIALWGTGLGPVTTDETQPAPGGDMPNIPVQVFIGGQPASVLYRGRNACCSSVDTVYVTVPKSVATGCAVSVNMQIGTMVSNSTTIPIASTGRTCTPLTSAITPLMYTQLLAQGAPLAIGDITLTYTVATTSVPGPQGALLGSTAKTSSGAARFVSYGAPASAVLDSSAVEVPAPGSCSVTTFAGTSGDPLALLQPTYLDAGSSLAVNGPLGTETLNRAGLGGTILYNGNFDKTGAYLATGQYTVSGLGGNDVALFNANLNVPTPVNWTNQTPLVSVNRAQGITVTWDPTTGDPNGYVSIGGSNTLAVSAGPSSTIGVTFACAAPTTAGTFTVPPYVLLAIPPSVSVGGLTVPGTLSVTGVAAPVFFSADGLDLGSATYTSVTSSSAVFE